MSRLSKIEYFMQIAAVVGVRSTCLRRRVGCVLVNERGHILATGYNGVAAGMPHCNEPGERTYDRYLKRDVNSYPNACPGANAKSGTQLESCEAIHAEMNALLQCRDVFVIHTAYCTTAPCVTCTKLLLGTSCREIVYMDDYDASGLDLWRRAGRNELMYTRTYTRLE